MAKLSDSRSCKNEKFWDTRFQGNKKMLRKIGKKYGVGL